MKYFFRYKRATSVKIRNRSRCPKFKKRDQCSFCKSAHLDQKSIHKIIVIVQKNNPLSQDKKIGSQESKKKLNNFKEEKLRNSLMDVHFTRLL